MVGQRIRGWDYTDDAIFFLLNVYNFLVVVIYMFHVVQAVIRLFMPIPRSLLI